MAFRIPLSPLVHQAAWRLDLVQQLLLMHGEDMEPSATLRSSFWEAVPVTFISRTAPHAPPAAWLPALTAAVRTEQAPWILKVLADWPLPDRIPPEAVPWLDDLISVCESQRAAMHLYRDNVASHLYEKTLRALIRLEQINRSPENSPPARLAEWLGEACHVVTLPEVCQLPRLATLARWRPSAGPLPPSPVLDAWMVFWRDLGDRSRYLPQRAIALQSLLNLTEGGLSVPGLNPDALLYRLAELIRQADPNDFTHGYLSVWQPGTFTPYSTDALRNLAEIWLEITRKTNCLRSLPARKTAWERLVAWDRMGLLDRCGIPLLPHMLTILEEERSGEVLKIISTWSPPSSISRMDSVERLINHWQTFCHQLIFEHCQAGFTGLLRLADSGLLLPEEKERCWQEYLEASRWATDKRIASFLAHLVPPHQWFARSMTIWLQKLNIPDEAIHFCVLLAVRNHLETGPPSVATRHWFRKMLRHCGEQQQPPVPFMNLPPEVLPPRGRITRLATALATGQSLLSLPETDELSAASFSLSRIPAAPMRPPGYGTSGPGELQPSPDRRFSGPPPPSEGVPGSRPTAG